MFRTTWYYLLDGQGEPRGSQMRDRDRALMLAAEIARRGRSVDVFSVEVETPSGLCGEPRRVARYSGSDPARPPPQRTDNIIPFPLRRRS